MRYIRLLCAEQRVEKKIIFFEEPKSGQVKATAPLCYDGVPFTVYGSVLLECQYGKRRQVRRSKKTSSQVTTDFIYIIVVVGWTY